MLCLIPHKPPWFKNIACQAFDVVLFVLVPVAASLLVSGFCLSFRHLVSLPSPTTFTPRFHHHFHAQLLLHKHLSSFSAMADASASECVAKRKRSHSLSPGEVSESPALKKQDTSLPRATPQPVLNRSTYSPHLQISASINPPTGPAQSAPRSSSNRFYIPPFSQSVSYHARPQVPQKRMPVKHEHSSPPSIARHPSVPAFGQVTAPRSAMVYGHVPERASHITPFEGRSSLPRQHQVVGQAAQSDERKYSPFHGYRDRQDRLLSSESSGYVVYHQERPCTWLIQELLQCQYT